MLVLNDLTPKYLFDIIPVSTSVAIKELNQSRN